MFGFNISGNYSGGCLLARDSIRCAPQGRVFKIGIKICSKKVSILSAFRLLIFNTFKVKNSSLNICTTRCILVTL